MMLKKTQTIAWGSGLFLIVLVIVGGGILFFQKQLGVEMGTATFFAKKEDGNNTKKVAVPISTRPIIKDNKGVTEISLPGAPENVSKLDIEQLKAFRKRSEELERAVAALKKEKGENELVVMLGDAPLRVDPLYTFEAQQKGLLGRDSLPADTGMLYIFQMDDPGRLFGTKGMKFSVDMIWVNDERTVVHISKNVPPDFSGDLKSVWPARYVLEVNGGYADKHGIDVGDTIDFGKVPH